MIECSCVVCDGCGGSGNIYVDHRGRYLGQHRTDDLGDMEPCDGCRGSGVSEMCEFCYDQDDREFEELEPKRAPAIIWVE